MMDRMDTRETEEARNSTQFFELSNWQNEYLTNLNRKDCWKSGSGKKMGSPILSTY